MKKTLSLLLAVILVVCAFCLPVSAGYADKASTQYIQYGTTAHDLQAYGIHTFQASRVTSAPQVNGVIGTGEYGNAPSDVATIGDGLTLTNGTATTDYTDAFGEEFKNFKLTSYLVYDDTYVYIAEELVADKAISIINAAGDQNLALNTHVRYGLNQSPNIPEAASRLSNSYAYRYDTAADNFNVSGCIAANRNYKVLEGAISKSVTLDDECYSDWTMAKYAANTAVNYSASGNQHTYVFEYKIPLADVIFSATGDFKEADVAALLANSTFYGSYLFQVAVTRTGGDNGNTQMFLTTGYAGGREIEPYSTQVTSSSTSSWAKAVKAYWTTKNGESISINYVPSPVIHGPAGSVGTLVPPATQLRPGLSGFRLGNVASAYKLGSTATFTVIPDCVENKNPTVGDLRVIPQKFQVRNGFDTKLTGGFDSDFKTARFSTAELPVGVNTLVVTFVQQSFDGSKWVDTSYTKNFSRNFTVAGSVMGVAGGSSQTGDSTVILFAGAGVMLLAAGSIAVVVSKKRKVK